MTIQQTIEKAIEGGFLPGGKFVGLYSDVCDVEMLHSDGTADSICRYEMFLSPIFWQSLGKAIGWETVAENGYNKEKLIRSYRGYSRGYGEKMWESALKKEGWNYQWHRFIAHLSEGKDAESFFETL